MNLFAEPDRSQLVGPPDLFDGAAHEEEHGAWGHQLLRAATALEMLTQITGRDLRVLLKGGTLLQNSLAWPPYRASVDLDLDRPAGEVTGTTTKGQTGHIKAEAPYLYFITLHLD